MKPVDLDELERLHAAATPGPWEHHRPLDDRAHVSRFATEDSDPQPVATFGEWKSNADNAALIAALRNAWPALSAELRTRRKQVEEARRALRMVLDYRRGKKPFDFHKITDDYERNNQQFDSWQRVEAQVVAALASLESGESRHE